MIPPTVVTPGSAVAGDAHPRGRSKIVRDSRGFVPDPATTLQACDRLLVVAVAGVRLRTERRLRAVSRAGRLAGRFGEHGR